MSHRTLPGTGRLWKALAHLGGRIRAWVALGDRLTLWKFCSGTFWWRVCSVEAGRHLGGAAELTQWRGEAGGPCGPLSLRTQLCDVKCSLAGVCRCHSLTSLSPQGATA